MIEHASLASNPLRACLVGCGEAGVQKHLRALATVREVELVAVMDGDPAVARRTAAACGIPGWTDSLDGVLADGRIEAVAVVVPPASHAAVAVAAIHAGKHVLVEKPLALGLDDAERIEARAATVRTVAVMGFHMRFHRLVREAREIVRSGVLGSIESIHSVWHSPRADEGLPAWRKQRESGGGALVEIGVHHIDLWSFLLGRGVQRVFARSEHGTRDDERVVITASLDGGIVATASFSERSPHAIGFTVCGDRGRLEVDCLRFDGLRIVKAGEDPGRPGVRARELLSTLRALPRGIEQVRSGGEYLGSYRRLWRHFAAAVRDRVPVESTLSDGVAALRVVLAAAESASTGNEVAVGEAPRFLAAARERERVAMGERL